MSTSTKLDHATSEIALGKSVVPDHPLDVEAFHSDPALARSQLIGNFVPVLVPKVSHPSVQPVYPSPLLCPVASTLRLATERSLSAAQLRQFLLKVARVSYSFSVRSRYELRQPDVKTDCGEGVRDSNRLRDFASRYEEPFIGCTLKAKRLNRSLKCSVQTDADPANVLHPQSVAFESNAVAVAREENRVKPLGAFEPRVTELLTGFEASKEALESFIQPAQGALRAAEACKP